jgi:hypothetical protein
MARIRGKPIATGLVFAIVGYDYRQITGDFGPGSKIGSSQAMHASSLGVQSATTGHPNTEQLWGFFPLCCGAAVEASG